MTGNRGYKFFTPWESPARAD